MSSINLTDYIFFTNSMPYDSATVEPENSPTHHISADLEATAETHVSSAIPYNFNLSSSSSLHPLHGFIPPRSASSSQDSFANPFTPSSPFPLDASQDPAENLRSVTPLPPEDSSDQLTISSSQSPLENAPVEREARSKKRKLTNKTSAEKRGAKPTDQETALSLQSPLENAPVERKTRSKKSKPPNVLLVETQKYATDEKFRETSKTRSKERYDNDPAYRDQKKAARQARAKKKKEEKDKLVESRIQWNEKRNQEALQRRLNAASAEPSLPAIEGSAP